MAMQMDSQTIPSRGVLGSFIWGAAGLSALVHGGAILAAVTLFDDHPPVIIETVSVDIVFEAGPAPGGDPRPVEHQDPGAEAPVADSATLAAISEPGIAALSGEAAPVPLLPPTEPPAAVETPPPPDPEPVTESEPDPTPPDLEPAVAPEPDLAPVPIAASKPDPLPVPVVAALPQPELVALRVPEAPPPVQPPVEEKLPAVRNPIPVPPPLPKARMFEHRPPVDAASAAPAKPEPGPAAAAVADAGTALLPVLPAGQAAGKPVEVASVAAALSAIAPGAGAAAPSPAVVAARYRSGSAGNAPPKYPHRARRLGYEGRVVLRVEVLPSGETGSVDIVSGSGHGILDKAAVKAVRRWRFLPATHAGVPVADTLDVPITFRLKD
jgi:protein TonB